jgi:hypothetical protein
LERALGNNSPLIQWREEEWGWRKEEGKYKKECLWSVKCKAAQPDMDSSAYIHFTQKVQITHEK